MRVAARIAARVVAGILRGVTMLAPGVRLRPRRVAPRVVRARTATAPGVAARDEGDERTCSAEGPSLHVVLRCNGGTSVRGTADHASTFAGAAPRAALATGTPGNSPAGRRGMHRAVSAFMRRPSLLVFNLVLALGACTGSPDGSPPGSGATPADAGGSPGTSHDAGVHPGGDAGADGGPSTTDAGPASGDDGGAQAACAPSWTVTPQCGGPSSGAAPDFGPNVVIFDPSTSAATIQKQLDSIYGKQDAAQFDTGRYALLFKPGQYDLDVKVGFYTQVLGLGRSPDDVTITGAVRAKADWLGSNNATCNFWRGAENLAVVPSQAIDGGTDVWAVSQGTHLRRVHVKGDIKLDDGGWSSGGFVADSLIDGQITSGSQQQFLTRNDDQHWSGSNWNMVFVGDGDAARGELAAAAVHGHGVDARRAREAVPLSRRRRQLPRDGARPQEGAAPATAGRTATRRARRSRSTASTSRRPGPTRPRR